MSPLTTPMPAGSEFGIPDPEGAPDKRGRRFHAGKDWFAPEGSTVIAPITGLVIEAKPSRGTSGQVFGGTVKIQDAQGRVFVFRHVVPGVKAGQRVRAGVPVATVSPWTGGSPHAHIEVWRTRRGGYRYENLVDPVTVFGSRR